MARRTVYGHFSGRSALVEGLVEDAAQALRDALTDIALPIPDAVTALTRFVLTLWPVGDRYRTLLRLAPQDLAAEHADRVLGPARATVTAIIAAGQRQDVFHTDVPATALGRALEAFVLALLDCVNNGTWSDDGTRTAAATLIAVGVDGDLAAAHVDRLRPPERVGARTPASPGGNPCTSPGTTPNPPTAAAPWT